jgi:hypothetical protein
MQDAFIRLELGQNTYDEANIGFIDQNRARKEAELARKQLVKVEHEVLGKFWNTIVQPGNGKKNDGI